MCGAIPPLSQYALMAWCSLEENCSYLITDLFKPSSGPTIIESIKFVQPNVSTYSTVTFNKIVETILYLYSVD
jgi:hypothetical protein